MWLNAAWTVESATGPGIIAESLNARIDGETLTVTTTLGAPCMKIFKVGPWERI